MIRFEFGRLENNPPLHFQQLSDILKQTTKGATDGSSKFTTKSYRLY